MIKFWIEKSNRFALKLTALLMLFSLLYSSLAAPYAEASLWTERRQSRTANTEKNKETKIYTVRELAKFIKVSPHTIYYWVSRNEIPYVKVGKHLRFKTHDVIQHFEKQHSTTSAACQFSYAKIHSISRNYTDSGSASNYHISYCMPGVIK